VVEAFQSDPKIGLLTGKIKDYRDNKERLLLPFGQRALKANSALVDSRHRVSYFRAGFYAVRREVIEKCGSYRPEMRYGEEELDLSYRVIAAGYDIVYEPKAGAYHWPEPSAFRTDHPRHEIYYQIKNRFYLAHAYLPTLYIPSYISIWLARYLAASLQRGHLSDYFAGVKDGIVEMRRASRRRLDDRAVDYLRNNYGRLWY
jgi:GT2 family glycosyltransferase